MTNTTLQETDPSITYKGTWENNTNPLFSGGGTTYTNTDSSFSFQFEGSYTDSLSSSSSLIESVTD